MQCGAGPGGLFLNLLPSSQAIVHVVQTDEPSRGVTTSRPDQRLWGPGQVERARLPPGRSPPVVIPIPGSSRPETIRASTQALDLVLTPEQVSRLNQTSTTRAA